MISWNTYSRIAINNLEQSFVPHKHIYVYSTDRNDIINIHRNPDRVRNVRPYLSEQWVLFVAAADIPVGKAVYIPKRSCVFFTCILSVFLHFVVD